MLDSVKSSTSRASALLSIRQHLYENSRNRRGSFVARQGCTVVYEISFRCFLTCWEKSFQTNCYASSVLSVGIKLRNTISSASNRVKVVLLLFAIFSQLQVEVTTRHRWNKVTGTRRVNREDNVVDCVDCEMKRLENEVHSPKNTKNTNETTFTTTAGALLSLNGCAQWVKKLVKRTRAGGGRIT